MMIDASDLKNLLINPSIGNKGHFVSTCFFCNKPNHFYINSFSGLWDCKRCGETGNIYKLLIFLNLENLLERKTYAKNIDKLENLKEINSDNLFNFSKSDIIVPEIKIENFKKIFYNQYLESRNFQKSDYSLLNIGKINDLKYRGYVIIPIFEDKKIKSFISRNTLKNNNPRYKNCSETDISKLLFGIDEVTQKTNTVILVEGFFGKHNIDSILNLKNEESIKCLATFGKKISNFQIIKLALKNIKKVILFYDNDAIKESKNFSEKLSKFFQVEVALLDELGKDPADLNPDKMIKILSNTRKTIDFNFSTLPYLKK